MALPPAHNARMQKFAKWLLLVFVLTCMLLSAGLFALQRWIGTDDFRVRVQDSAGEALGRSVRLGALAVDILPLPAVVLNHVEVGTRPVMRLERVEVRPVLAALFGGRLELSTLLVRRADVSQAAVDDLMQSLRARRSTSAGGDAPGPVQLLVPQRVVLDALTWRSASGAATMLNADARLDSQGLPDHLALTVLAGQLQGARAGLVRNGQVWDVDAEIAGGSVKGVLELQVAAAPAAGIALSGRLETRNIELAVLSRRRSADGAPASPVSGKLEASTTLRARAGDWGGLAEALESHSTFTVRQAVLHGLDLARAVKTVGLSRGGETRLDTLAGQVATRGRSIQLRNLVASSGVLSAHGNLAIAPSRALSGRVNVNLGAKVVGSAVGVPLVVGGTLDAPELTLTRAAMVGAALGTLVMPGVGTGAGAAFGDKLGEGLKGLFGK